MNRSRPIQLFIILILFGGIAFGIITFLVERMNHSDEFTSPLGSGLYSQPTWSPDGVHLVFTYRPSNGSGIDGLWVLDLTSQKMVEIPTTHFLGIYSGAAWQNNQVLWFIQNSALYKVDIANNNPTLVINSDDSWEGLTFQSSDKLIFAKQWITMDSQPYKPNDLYIFTPSDGLVTQMTNTSTINERDPIYSRDGKRLAYVAEDVSDLTHSKRPKPGLDILEADGTIRHLAVSARNGIKKLAWSPNGQYILTISDYDEIGNYDPRLYLYPADGTGKPKKIVTSYDQDGLFGLAWSPTGSKIAITTVGNPRSNDLHIIPSNKLELANDLYTK